MGKPEGEIESYLLSQARKNGYMCMKFVSPSTSGVPDRVLVGHGLTFFVELKAPGEVPRKLQLSVMRQMREHGAHVFVADTKEAVDEVLGKAEALWPRDEGTACVRDETGTMNRIYVIGPMSESEKIRETADYYMGTGRYEVRFVEPKPGESFTEHVSECIRNILWANRVYVVPRPDGTVGKGVTYETAFARALGKRVERFLSETEMDETFPYRENEN